MSEFKKNLHAVALKVKSDNCEYLTKKDRQTDTWQRDQNNVQQFKQNSKKFCKGLTYCLEYKKFGYKKFHYFQDHTLKY